MEILVYADHFSTCPASSSWLSIILRTFPGPSTPDQKGAAASENHGKLNYPPGFCWTSPASWQTASQRGPATAACQIKALQRVVKPAQSITGLQLSSIKDICHKRCLRRVRSMIKLQPWTSLWFKRTYGWTKPVFPLCSIYSGGANFHMHGSMYTK